MALPLKCQHVASTWPTQLSRSGGHTPQSGARMRPRGLDAREHMVRGPSATRPPGARVGHWVRRGPTARAMGL